MPNNVEEQNPIENQVDAVDKAPETGKTEEVIKNSEVTPDKVVKAVEEAQEKIGEELGEAVSEVPDYLKSGYEMFGNEKFVKDATESGLKGIPDGEAADFAVVMMWGYPGAIRSVEDWNSKTEDEKKSYIEKYESFKKINSTQEKAEKSTESKEETEKPDTYKGMPAEDYLEKHLKGVDVSTFSEESGDQIKEYMKKIPIENVNGFVYGVNQIAEKMKQSKVDFEGGKIDKEEYEKLKASYKDRLKFGAKVCAHDYSKDIEIMKKKIPADVLEKNPKLLEVGFLGTSEGQDEYLKKVEGILKDSGVKGNEAYWYAKTLLNMKGYEHPQGAPKSKPPSSSVISSDSGSSYSTVDTYVPPSGGTLPSSPGESVVGEGLSISEEEMEKRAGDISGKWHLLNSEGRDYVSDFYRKYGWYPDVNTVPESGYKTGYDGGKKTFEPKAPTTSDTIDNMVLDTKNSSVWDPEQNKFVPRDENVLDNVINQIKAGMHSEYSPYYNEALSIVNNEKISEKNDNQQAANDVENKMSEYQKNNLPPSSGLN